ncbi:hypothetical protein LTR66_016136 [Elasticomyces elasticus]|nr:hypothetical protein LTR66_016136 [Elasticomyces elasticus]
MLSNHTNQSQIWVDRTTGLLAAADVFFTPYHNASNIMFEAACETVGTCNTDQYSMKAYLARWMAATSVMAPYTAGQIGTYLRASAIGASNACTGGPYGNTCGVKWYTGAYEGHGQYELGQEMSALEVIVGLLANNSIPPRTMPAPVPPPASLGLLSTTTSIATSIASSTTNPTLFATNSLTTTSTTSITSTSSIAITADTTSTTANPPSTASRAAVSVQTTNGGSKSSAVGLAISMITLAHFLA